MSYVDGFVLAVPKEKLDAYKALARRAGEVWKEHGALSYVECVADDVPYGELTSFPRSVQAEADETVVFAWITRSEEHTSELQSLMRISYAVFCLNKKKPKQYYKT